MTYLGLMLVLVCVGVGVRAYPNYVPTEACREMFPIGHNKDAQTTAPPFELLVSTTSYTAGSTVTVTLNTTQPDTWYFEGMFVQARRAEDCGTTTPVGTFSFASSDTYLQTLACSAASDSVTHNKNVHTFTKTVTWTAPSPAIGHIYFRATVVKNEETFWTTVASPVVRDSTAAAPSASWTPCPTKLLLNAASPIAPRVLPLVGAILVALLVL